MLHFFRKIRHDLIANSQTFKYLKYAIGEIILVVLGILIALQINSWNEKRGDYLKKEVYILRLTNDLAKDTVGLAKYVKVCEKEIRNWRNIEKQLQKPNATVDSIVNIFITFFSYVPQLGHPNNATFESMLSTGDIDLFEEDHMVMLMDFYFNMDRTYSNISTYSSTTDSKMQEVYKEFGFLRMSNKTSLIYKKMRGELDEAKFLRTYYNLVRYNAYRMNYFKQDAYYKLVATKTVLNALNNPNEPNERDIYFSNAK